MFYTKNRNHKRLFALLLVFAPVIGMIPSALADNEPDISAVESAKESLVDSQTEEEPVITPPIQSIIESDEAAEDSEIEPDYEAPTSMDGETLTRMDNGGIMLLGGSGTMGKSTCVTFAAYQSSRWKCHRYEVDGSHSYGHYFYTSEIAYHTIDGVDSFCIPGPCIVPRRNRLPCSRSSVTCCRLCLRNRRMHWKRISCKTAAMLP